MSDYISEYDFAYLDDNKAREIYEKEIARIRVQLEQEQDIRKDRENALTLLAEALNVETEPHQTFDERLLEAPVKLKARNEKLERVVRDEADWQMERHGLVSQRLTKALNQLNEVNSDE